MDCKNFSSKKWKTPCGLLKMSKILSIVKTIFQIFKAIIARCLFVLYSFFAVWRVTEALDNDKYWLLLFTLLPLGLETLHAILTRKGGEMKWVTPNVFFYLLCAIPCIWLLELKLLDDRLGTSRFEPGGTSSNTLNETISSLINISLSDESWTLALEQILMFVLVLAKWIAPKGEMSLDALSQLLLVNIAAGADIIELMEVFSVDAVSENEEIVYMVMTAWTWSLLQFTIVLTASKDLPELDDDKYCDKVVIGENKTKLLASDQEDFQTENDKCAKNETTNQENSTCLKSNGKSELEHSNATNGQMQVNGSSKKTHRNGKLIPGVIAVVAPCHLERSNSEIVEIEDESHLSDSSPNREEIHDKLRAEEEVDALLQGRRCFECFCCYNEIWGMLLSIFFQDGPFFILRLVILLHYKVVTHMNIFFTCKNIFVIILLLNRIRAVVKQDRRKWLNYMTKVKQKRRIEKDEARKRRGLPPKTKSPKSSQEACSNRNEMGSSHTPRPSKPRWAIWRA